MKRSPPATMPEATTTTRATPLLPGLPDDITVWEILIRLPPKCILRCRAVCPAWRRATSARDFLLAHHARQPTLPLLCGYNFVSDGIESLDIVPVDHRPGVAAADQLRSVARFADASSRPDACFILEACCDGLLVLSTNSDHFVLCNPATREYAALPLPPDFLLLGMYPHRPTGEHRLLLYTDQTLRSGEFTPDALDGCYIFALGSGQPLRHIGEADAEALLASPFLFRGGLHWHQRRHESRNNMIIVFDTVTESLHEMRAPVVPGFANLFEMDRMLGMSGFNAKASTIDIWMAQDYESEVWALKRRVKLPVAEIMAQFGKFAQHWNVVFASWSGEGDVLVLVKFGQWLLQVDMDGKLVASFPCKGLNYTQLWLKQTLVSHAFFPTLERYVVNASPFI